MNAILSIDLDQLKTLIAQCDIDEKIELIRFLEEETFQVQFNQLLTNGG